MQTVNLNYGWKYRNRFDESLLAPEADEAEFETVDIPHANQELPYNNFDEELYQFVSCYRKKIDVPQQWEGKKLILTFEAVANYAKVYVNGNFAFEHKGSYTSFSGDIAPLVEYGKENVIAVMVDSTERSEIPPFGGVVDYLVYGGIYREVYLYVHEPIYAERLLLTPSGILPAKKTPAQPRLNAKVLLNAPADGTEVKFEVFDADGRNVAMQTAVAQGNSAEVQFDMKDAVLWDIDNPYLYTVTARLGSESISDRCGMRHCQFRKNGFYLNGKKLKIVGLNRHQSYPYVGYAMPKSAQEEDAVLLKQHLGCNLARTSHYPNSKHFLNKCDEIGLLVFTEIPGWQYLSKDAEWRDIVLQHVNEMILEDYNHPSIILWGVRINESGDDDQLYAKTNEIAHKLDPERQTGGVRCFPRSRLLEDVYTFNDFIHSGGKMILLPKFIVCGNKPLLITEYAGHMFPTKTFDHEKKRQEHALRHARVLNKMFSDDKRAGCIGWCMFDYNTHKDFGSGDKICYHGVTDMFRIDKLAASVYKIQQREYPVLEISSNMEIGDNAGGQVGDVYLFTNCDTVKMYKNGLLINTFDMKEEWNKSPFPHIPMPPVYLNDTIGDQLKHDETYRFSDSDADKLKRALLAVKKFGTFGGIFRHPFTFIKSLIKYKLSIDSITMLFGKYVTSWGGKQITYKFEGYMNGKHVITTEKGSVNDVQMEVAASTSQLIEDATYDTARIQIRALSQCGNVMPYDCSVINVTSNGIVDVIGPDQFSLIGGQRGFWIKTKGIGGKAELTIQSPTLGKQTLTFDVVKKEL